MHLTSDLIRGNAVLSNIDTTAGQVPRKFIYQFVWQLGLR